MIVKIHNRGWDCTGAQIEIGENIEEGVLREIFKESGVRAKVKTLCGIYSNIGQHLFYDGVTQVPTKVTMDFICEYDSGQLQCSKETSVVIWVHRDKVMDYITSPTQRYRFEKILNFESRITYASYLTRLEFKLMYERYV